MDTSSSVRKYLEYLRQVIGGRLKEHFSPGTNFAIDTISLPADGQDDSPLPVFIRENNLNQNEVVVLLTAFAPHVDPVFFDNLIQDHIPGQGDFPQFGGMRGRNHRGFLPTAETVLFILAGADLGKRFECQKLFDKNHLFSAHNVIFIDDQEPGEPFNSGKLMMAPEYVEWFTTGEMPHPQFSMDFPAEYITTEMVWDDLVLNPATRKQIDEIRIWINNHLTLMNEWGMKRKLKPGYRSLFHGPAGTGKTLTATLLGKYTGKDVFKIDLSMVVSKFIGETEKNLAKLFDKAENKDWILFFDEADALFGKRTNIRDAHDKYANQEASYLLQRIETFDGLVILASNFRNNIDEAFIRRFHSIIYFPMPSAAERLEIWQKGFPEKVKFDRNVDLQGLSKKYELTGSAIMNAVQYSCLQALSRNSDIIGQETILEGIKREYEKEGKIW